MEGDAPFQSLLLYTRIFTLVENTSLVLSPYISTSVPYSFLELSVNQIRPWKSIGHFGSRIQSSLDTKCHIKRLRELYLFFIESFSILKRIEAFGTYSRFLLLSPYRRRSSVSRAIGLYLHSYYSEIPVKGFSHEKRGKHAFTFQGVPGGRKVYKQRGTTWFPEGIVDDTAITTRVPCSLHHDTFYLGLGKPQPR
jgi:hypothetical protein